MFKGATKRCAFLFHTVELALSCLCRLLLHVVALAVMIYLVFHLLDRNELASLIHEYLPLLRHFDFLLFQFLFLVSPHKFQLFHKYLHFFTQFFWLILGHQLL